MLKYQAMKNRSRLTVREKYKLAKQELRDFLQPYFFREEVIESVIELAELSPIAVFSLLQERIEKAHLYEFILRCLKIRKRFVKFCRLHA